MKDKGKDYEKYNKLYNKEGIMTKKGVEPSKYGVNSILDKKWDRYGHACEGKPQLNDLLSLNPTSIIDIGCGYNEFLDLISSHDENIPSLGVDIACPAADVIAPAHNLPIEDKQYDMLVSFDCMEHIPEEEVELSLKEFSRVADRVYLQISLHDSPTKIDGEPVHVCVKPKEWWLEVCRKYFPNATIRVRNKKGQPSENIIIYGDNRK